MPFLPEWWEERSIDEDELPDIPPLSTEITLTTEAPRRNDLWTFARNVERAMRRMDRGESNAKRPPVSMDPPTTYRMTWPGNEEAYAHLACREVFAALDDVEYQIIVIGGEPESLPEPEPAPEPTFADLEADVWMAVAEEHAEAIERGDDEDDEPGETHA